MKSLGIIGMGTVGKAVGAIFKHYHEVITYDKKNKGGIFVYRDGIQIDNCYCGDPIKLLLEKINTAVFVCVPSPSLSPVDGYGPCDTSKVKGVVAQIDTAAKALGVKIKVIIKSTVVPGTTELLNLTFDNVTCCYNPDSIRTITAVEDFKNQKTVILGGPPEPVAVAKQIYQAAFPNIQVVKTSSTVAEMVKYTANCFLAVKVSFANEMKQICDSVGVDWDKVVEYTIKDERVGSSHWAVPGFDGSLGFGGDNLSKDINALVSFAKVFGVDAKVMKAAWEKNMEVRPDKNG
jgi:UDPglucose 6-dehydrogenase